MFSRRQVEAADTACDLYQKIGRPDEAEFYFILTTNLIRKNCPVTPHDARRASHKYGPDVAALKGKMHSTTAAPRAPTFDAPISTHHCNVTLCVDFFLSSALVFYTQSLVVSVSERSVRLPTAATRPFSLNFQ